MIRQSSASIRGRPARSTKPHRACQAGLTLIETLVALAVIAIAVVGIAYGFGSVVRGSSLAQQQATLDAAARTASSRLRNPALSYEPCAKVGTYALGIPPSGVTWSITAVAESVPRSLSRPTSTGSGSNRSGVAPIAGGSCAASYDYGIQEITVRVCTSRCIQQTVWKGDT